MGGLGGSRGQASASTGRGTSPAPVTKEFTADRPQIMPVYNSPAQLESAKRRRDAASARSGRTSTNLVGNPGTEPYKSSFLGSVS